MSPIIDLQRRMVEAGRIRAGDTSNGHPRKLDKWRLTSKDKTRLEAAAVLWGGEVKEWEGRVGEYELYTTTAELPIMLLPETEPSVYYELWTKGGCQRRCDGQHELLSDSSCLCGDERECKPHLRFPVLLPDLKGIGSWLVQSTGWNAANEIPGAMALLSRATAQGVLMPARLRLEQRVEIKSGQTRRFAVPVIDVDVSFRELMGGAISQPLGYQPVREIGSGNGVSLEQGLAIAETQTATRTARSAAPLPKLDDILFGDSPVPVDDPGAPSGASAPADSPCAGLPSPAVPQAQDSGAAVGNSAVSGSAPPTSGVNPSEPRPEKPLTLAQSKKKLNALVGQLRDGGHITTEQLYSAMAKSRIVDVDVMMALLNPSTPGELHWSTLRDDLQIEEARDLHARLARLWVNVEKDDGA